jgi:ligand-binding sensor protein
MTLQDLLPVEKWIDLEKHINKAYGLNAAVFDKDGQRITNYVNWANTLCPVVKNNERGRSYICALAHKNITSEIDKTGKPSVVECDAGLVKFAVPIYWDDELLGVAGGCGRIINGNSVESFLIKMITGIDEREIKKLSTGINSMESVEVERAVDSITKELGKLIGENAYQYRQNISQSIEAGMNLDNQK